MIPALPDAARVLSGLVLRPGQLRWDGQRYTGPELAALDIPAGQSGIIKVLRERDFIGLIAARPELAQEAAARLQLRWRARLTSPPDSASGGKPAALDRSYHWPLDSKSPPHDWAMAWRQDQMLVVWSAAPTPALARELSRLLGLGPAQLHLLSNGNPADPGALDCAADAALLAWSVDRPVRVPRQNLAGVAMATIRLQAGLTTDRLLHGQHIAVDASLRDRPSLARLLSHGPAGIEGKTVSPYSTDTRVSVRPAALPPQAQGKQDAALVFAQESFIDEAAALAGQDPVAYRLAHLPDGKGRELVQALAAHAGWGSADTLPAINGQRHGRGFAYAHVRDDTHTPPQESWTAWVAEVSVDERNGEVQIERVVVGHEVDNLAPMTPQAPRLEDHLGRAAQDALAASGRHDDWQLQGPQGALPCVDVLRPAPAAALAWSESASLPAAAAIANAIHDATGIRLREPGFAGAQQQLTGGKRVRRPRRAAWLAGAAVAAAGLAISAWPFKAAIAPIDGPDLSLYSAAAIERGRLVAAASDCVVCHTAPGGTPNTGGLALDTPFGVIYTSNITPDKETGIGRWSYAAFERAMRQGIHRDGRQLYPAFPYTAYAKLSDGDMQSLYAYLMSQAAVAAKPPETRLAFPYNIRPLMAGWNTLFHDDKPFVPDASQSQLWNRGAYLVQGAGHCGACHTPRNALGAEKSGAQNFLAGGSAEGWEAPALNALSRAPLPWTEEDLYRYLRTGYSERHGVAAGPMAPVIHGLAELPDIDVRAIAHYLSALNPPAPATATVASLETATAAQASVFPASGERVFQGACAVCHDSSGPRLFGARPSLALNSNLHSTRPDNLVQVILRGIPDPANGELGYMPGFGDSLTAQQINDLVVYLRARYAPDQAAWSNIQATIERLSKH